MADLSNLPEVFCIVESWTRFIGMSQRTYELYTAPRIQCCRELSRAEARAIIARKGLTKALETPDGCIYDSPERDFLKKYKGWYQTHK